MAQPPPGVSVDGPVVTWRASVSANAIVEISPTVQDVLGYAPAEVLGYVGSWQLHAHPDDRETLAGAVRRAVVARAPALEHEFRYRHKNGRYCWLAARFTFEYDPDGRLTGLSGSTWDVTAQVRAQWRCLMLERIVAAAAQEADPDRVLRLVLHELLALTDGAHALIARGDGQRFPLVPIHVIPTAGRIAHLNPQHLRTRFVRRVLTERRTIVEAYRGATDPSRRLASWPLRARIGAPLSHAGQVFGIVLIQQSPGAPLVSADDTTALELAAGFAGAALADLHHLRLEGAFMAARMALLSLNDRVAVLLETMERLDGAGASDGLLRSDLQGFAADAARFGRLLRRIEDTRRPSGPGRTGRIPPVDR